MKVRAEACGLRLSDLAARAGLARSTAYRAAKGANDSRGSTLRKLTAALIAAEETQRDYLIDLHGLPERAAFKVGGVMRRVQLPTIPGEEAA